MDPGADNTGSARSPRPEGEDHGPTPVDSSSTGGLIPTPPENINDASGGSNALLEQLLQLITANRPASNQGAKLPDPATFSSKSRHEYDKWIRYLERYLEWKSSSFRSDADKVLYASALLRGDFETAWTQEERGQDLTAYTWERFKTWLEDHVEDPQNRGWAASIKMTRLVQKEHQDASSFYTTFEEQFNQICGPDDPNPRETIKNRWFFSKLQNHLQESIQAMGAPPKISDLISMANRLHALRREKDKATSARGSTSSQNNNLKGRHGSNSSTPHQNTLAASATPQGVEKSSNRGNYRRGRGGRGGNRGGRKSSTIVCYNCNEEGHLSFNCPQKKTDSNKDSTSKPSNE
jgi:hypothetical protein